MSPCPPQASQKPSHCSEHLPSKDSKSFSCRWLEVPQEQYAEQFFAIWGRATHHYHLLWWTFFSSYCLFFIALNRDSKVRPVKGERRKLVSSQIPAPASIKSAAVLSTRRSVRWIHWARFIQITPIAIKEQRGGAAQYRGEASSKPGLGVGCAAAAAGGLLSILHGLFGGGGRQGCGVEMSACTPALTCFHQRGWEQPGCALPDLSLNL